MVKAKKSLSLLVALAVVLSLAIAVFPLASPVSADPGTHYYVNAATGNDGNAGSSGSPWKTISHAVDNVPAGSSALDPNVIHVAAGNYTTPNETFPITFDEENVTLLADSTAAIIDQAFLGTGTGTILKIEATGITIDGFTLDNAGYGIMAAVGGFNILDNIFSNNTDHDIYTGVHVGISEMNLGSNFSFDDILIDGNYFYITEDGVYIHIDLDFDDTETGLSCTIGDIDIFDNLFDMNTTDGVDIYIDVEEVYNGTISIGDVDISGGNEFTDGSRGVYFDGCLEDLNNTTVTVGDLMVNDNTFTDQTTYAVYIDYYDSAHTGYGSYNWMGTTTIDFGDIEVNGNDIASDQPSCTGVYIYRYGYWEYVEDVVTVTAGGIYINDNHAIDVDGKYAVYVGYYHLEYWRGDNASVTLGDCSIQRNVITAGTDSTDYGIFFEYDYVGYDFSGNTQFTAGDFYISDNEITGAGRHGVYVDFNYFGSETENSAIVTMGDLYIERNQIGTNTAVGRSGIYLYYDDFGSYTYDDSTVTGGNAYIQDNNIDAGSRGIYLYYDYTGYEMHDSSDVAIGEVHMTDNTIDAGSEAIYIYYEEVACYMCEDGTPSEDAALLMGDIYIEDNTIEGDSDGVYIRYDDDDVGCDMYDDAYARLPDYVITGNTFNVTGDGIYYYAYDVPYDINDKATIDFGSLLIDDNTFNGLTRNVADPMDYGVYIELATFCYDNYGYSTTIVGDYTISNNEFYDLDSDAIYIYYNDVGTDLDGNSTLEVGALEIGDNVIGGADNGIWVYYHIESYDDSTLTMGNLDITGNDLSNITNDGIYLYYDLDADDNSTQTIGRALIQDNILDPTEAADGIYVYMSKDSEAGATITLGEPVIDRNIIEEWTNGIYLRDVDGATISNNLIWHNDEGIYLDGSDNIEILYNDILTNPGPASGVHLDGDCGGNTTINYNNIVNNSSGDYGVYNANTGEVVDAENNWWGDPSGPYDPNGTTEVPPCTTDPATEINADGLGDKVTSNVDYCPWLTQQSQVTIYEETTTATGTGTASFQTDGGAITDLEAVDESTLPAAGKPDLYFPHGFFSFNITGLTPGQTVVVTITLPANVPVGTEYWKYHASEGGWIQIPMGSDDGDNIITITLIDGGLGDDDLAADGVIVDQGGPGFVPPPVGVGGEAYPVNKLAILAPWIALAAALIAGAYLLRKRRVARR